MQSEVNQEENLNRIITVPNLLSFFRLCLIPVIIWSYCVKKTPLLACEILLLSGLTDLADGYREVWGKPDTSENSTACWKLGNDTTLVVSYGNTA